MRLLIVEDDLELAAALHSAFERRTIATDHAANATDARLLLEAARYAAIILDLGLPDEDGSALLRRLRDQEDPVPVIVLTARGDVRDRVDGLLSGADDYLVKPFDFEELHARLLAVLRRQGDLSGPGLRVGNLQFDTVSREVAIDGERLILSLREADLLDLLIRRVGRVVPKRLAEDQLFGMNESLGSNAIEVYVHRLRRRLLETRARVTIDTVRGVGYILRASG